MELLTYPSEDVLEKASEAVNAMLEREFGGPLLFLLAGGSSLALLDSIRTQFLGAHMMIAMSDERFSLDPEINNFSQITRTSFYRNAQSRSVSFIETLPVPNETLTAFGERFDAELKSWRAKSPTGSVVMTQGIGPDGHTCSIMPFPHDKKKFDELFENKEKWAVGYDAGFMTAHPQRATATLSFLREEVSESIAYAVGSSKRAALKKLLKKDQNLNDVPAFILREMKKVTVFTDQKL